MCVCVPNTTRPEQEREHRPANAAPTVLLISWGLHSAARVTIACRRQTHVHLGAHEFHRQLSSTFIAVPSPMFTATRFPPYLGHGIHHGGARLLVQRRKRPPAPAKLSHLKNHVQRLARLCLSVDAGSHTLQWLRLCCVVDQTHAYTWPLYCVRGARMVLERCWRENVSARAPVRRATVSRATVVRNACDHECTNHEPKFAERMTSLNEAPPWQQVCIKHPLGSKLLITVSLIVS